MDVLIKGFWVLWELGYRESSSSCLGTMSTSAKVVREREAWKDFLSEIQSRAGLSVAVCVAACPRAPCRWQFGFLPSRSEFDDALKKMKFGKRGGIDDITVELVRLAGPALKDALFWVVSEMWEEASLAEEGKEADSWCDSSKTGVCIPMFKNKGCRFDKSNYRNLVMLSVSAKLVARIVASRMNRWLEDKLPEEQNGFRTGRGIDDVHMLFRRILEEVSVAAVGDEGEKHI